jgi:hypothetical protein
VVDLAGARKKAGWRELALDAGTLEAFDLAQKHAEIERAKRFLASRFRRKKAAPAENRYVPAKPWEPEVSAEAEDGMRGELTPRQKHQKLLNDNPDLFR